MGCFDNLGNDNQQGSQESIVAARRIRRVQLVGCDTIADENPVFTDGNGIGF